MVIVNHEAVKMKEYHGSNNGNRYVVFSQWGNKGTCHCGKEHVELISVCFDSSVEIQTYNGKHAKGKLFGFGSECINTFVIVGQATNPILASKEAAAQRKRSQFYSYSDLHGVVK
jgi:hypothetical protein